MLIIHVSSGLGNQMLSLAEYIAFQKMNPNQKCYIETINYSIKQDAIKMWNGYELDRIFGIDVPNVKSLFDEHEWEEIIEEIQRSNFWANGKWDCGSAFVNAFGNHGLHVKNLCMLRGSGDANDNNTLSSKFKPREIAKFLLGINYLKIRNRRWENSLKKEIKKPYGRIESKGNFLCGGDLKLMYKNHGMEEVEEAIRRMYVFPEYTDDRNKTIAEAMRGTASVSIHIRRGDLLGSNKDFYKYGYFKHAVEHIRKHVQSPTWFIFCLPKDVDWCRENIRTFGIDPEHESITYVDWNTGTESYRDMQLMSECKHNIITRTSFGFWAAYLNTNPQKITISPDALINTNTTIV